jgi:predicted phosphodiesterase
MRGFCAVAGVIGSVALAAALLAAPPAALVLTKGPYLQNPSSTAMTVQWETNVPGDGFVRFGAGEAMDQTAAAVAQDKVADAAESKDKKAPKRPACLYRARLTGLKPGSAYRYQVVPSKERPAEALPPAATFRTFPDKPEPFTFIAYGDSRSHPEKHRALAVHFMEHRPLFILHNGDMVSSSSAYDQWGPQYFAPLQDVINQVPMLMARGSHEPDVKPLLRLFDMPERRMWYAFDGGLVHGVVLDSRKDNAEVLRWLEADLAAAKAVWKIAMYHNPSFNLGYHKSDSGRATFLPILAKYGVDVILSGHSHLYERFKPLYMTAPAPRLESPVTAGEGAVTVADVPRHPITFITTGGGGASLKSAVQHPLLAKSFKGYHYLVFSVDAETLRLRTLGVDDEELDAMTITKKNGLYDAAYLAEAHSMEEAVFAQGGIRLAMPTLPGLPSGTTIPISLKIKFPALVEPVSATVGLADASAGDYAMLPVSVAVQPGKEVAVTLKVEARGKVALEKDAKDPRVSRLVPPLRFVLRAGTATFQQRVETSDVVLKKAEPDTPKPAKKDAPKPAAKKAA